ncbi:unnamed protein product, partial [Prorocentrum cordatum]
RDSPTVRAQLRAGYLRLAERRRERRLVQAGHAVRRRERQPQRQRPRRWAGRERRGGHR